MAVTRADLARKMERFENYFIPEPNSGCWLWIGGLNPDGYGSFRWSTRRSGKAHRISWRLYRGLLRGAHVLHRCDVRCCVNPDHLFLGDNAANVADRVAKGRTVAISGPAHPHWKGGISLDRGTRGIARGERVHGSKLTESTVREIRAATGAQRAIAVKFGVAQTLISQVKRKKVWRHVD